MWPTVDETGVYRSCKDSSVVLLSSFSLVDQEAVVVSAIGDVVAVHRWKSVVVVVGMKRLKINYIAMRCDNFFLVNQI